MAKEGQAIDEMHHSEWLIERILFLEGIPVVNELLPMSIGGNVPEMIKNDLAAESGAVKAYNDGIALAGDLGDEGTADLLVTILKMEEGHIDWAEKQLTQIEQMGLENYLGLKIGEPEADEEAPTIQGQARHRNPVAGAEGATVVEVMGSRARPDVQPPPCDCRAFGPNELHCRVRQGHIR